MANQFKDKVYLNVTESVLSARVYKVRDENDATLLAQKARELVIQENPDWETMSEPLFNDTYLDALERVFYDEELFANEDYYEEYIDSDTTHVEIMNEQLEEWYGN